MSVGVQRLRDEPEVIRKGALDKGEDATLVDVALALDARRRALLGEADARKAERNAASKQIGEAVRASAQTASGTGTAFDATVPSDAEVAALRAASVAAGERIAALDTEIGRVEAELEDVLLRIPNPADPDVPVGDADANLTVRTWGELLSRAVPAAGAAGTADEARAAGTADEAGTAAWERRPHWEVAERLGIFELERGAKIAGSGFPVYRGAGAGLQRALIDFFLTVHTRENGFTEIWPPAVVNAASARGTGQIPDKEDQMYVVTRDELYLIPTAEVPVTNLHRDEIFEWGQLPVRYAAYTPCFRREAGAAGKDTRGILRVHQFDKVEMVLFETPEASADALEWMVGRAEDLLRRLGLAYRVLLMATRDMGFVQAKKYDLEVWAPGVERWLEVSSCSNFRDYQARRMAIRHRPAPGARPELVHTLNGSGLALARVVAAILESYQGPDGSVRVPEPLQASLGTDVLRPPA
jgi:seryl-tRNA synthetase